VQPDARHQTEVAKRIEDLRVAVYASKIVSYAQGFALLRAASEENGWSINFGSCALLWRGGCIIRSVFLGKIHQAFSKNPQLSNLVLDPYFLSQLKECLPGWRRTVAHFAERGIPAPALSSALAWYDGYRRYGILFGLLFIDSLSIFARAAGSASMIQAQRDYFGAHTYERTDKPRGVFEHTNWTGRGGTTSASTYTL